MRFGVIAKYVGNSLLIVAAAMGLSAIVSGYYGFDEGFFPLVFSCLVTAILGAFPNIFVGNGQKINRSEGISVVVGSWLVCCLMGMIPYLMYGGEFTFENALFETISGFTTTGASILTEIEGLPQSIIFWRMCTAWIGGIGIIALFSLFVPSSQNSDVTLNSAEMSSLARMADGLKPRSFAYKTIRVYIILTVLASVSLRITGLGWFDAVTQAMSACSTCGFSSKNTSIAFFNSFPVELVLIVFMLLCSLRFSYLSNLILSRRYRLARFHSEVPRAFLLSVLFSTLLLTVLLLIKGDQHSVLESARVALFQVASIFTTTGFATVDTNTWTTICAVILVAGSFVCGCSGSTSGGIKMDRAVVGWKYLRRFMIHQRHPNLVKAVSVDGIVVEDDTCAEILLFIVCYMAAILAGTLLNVFVGLDLKTASTAAVACMGNVGPGLGMIGTMGNYSQLPLLSKWICMVLMIIGRLEIFPVIFFFKFRAK